MVVALVMLRMKEEGR